MREILFRGQTRRKNERTINIAGDKCDSNWVYGGIFPQNKGGDFAIIYQQDPDIQKFTVYADTVGQFTGLTDRNGNKIFEGDIIELDNSFDTKQKNFQVKFAYGQFYVGVNKPVAYLRNNCKVVGNIHDNPELISGDRGKESK